VRHRSVSLHEHVHPIEVEDRVAVGPGHVAVGLRDHDTAVAPDRLDGGGEHVDLDAQ
jgi:hypothetical protein